MLTYAAPERRPQVAGTRRTSEITVPPTPVKSFPDNEAATDTSVCRFIDFRSRIAFNSAANAGKSLRKTDQEKEREMDKHRRRERDKAYRNVKETRAKRGT